MDRDLVKRLRGRIREFEDRKRSGADLSREIYFVAREIVAPEQEPLRRSLERLGNRVAVLAEQGRDIHAHSGILEVADQVESELMEWGY